MATCTKFSFLNNLSVYSSLMSQVIQITKEKSTNSFSVLEYGDAKNASFSSSKLTANDAIGLSWVFLDNPVSYLTCSERRCNVNE